MIKATIARPAHRLLSIIPLAIPLAFPLASLSEAHAATLYSNGPLSTGPTSNSGVAAPAGYTWSEVQADAGNILESNTTAGLGAVQGSTRLADDFTVPVGQVWTISSVDLYSYKTGAAANPSPFIGYTLQVWNGSPSDAASMIVFGDTMTNRLATSTDSLMYRIFNTTTPAPGTAAGTTRKIWRNTVAIAPPLVLNAGTYWLDWASADNASGSHFDPGVTVVGSRALPGWNAQQLSVATDTWTPAIDAGNPTTAPDVAIDMPFEVTGTAGGVCGDGILFAEACDDGNLIDGDGCDHNCTVTACGNGVTTMGEACDDGNQTDGDGCDHDCTVTACGNGIMTMGEACDDGNQTDGDGCDHNCTVTACGNGVMTMGEACDDGNQTDGDGCDHDCTVTACGNGIKTMGEGCDDGNKVDGDGCDNNCTMTGCGNGVLTMGEACDDGNATSGDGCDNNCTPTACGNGVITMGETCDDGNKADGDGCDNNCTTTACGNGVTTAGEECDDGNTTNGDGCSATCKMENASSSSSTSGAGGATSSSASSSSSGAGGASSSSTGAGGAGGGGGDNVDPSGGCGCMIVGADRDAIPLSSLLFAMFPALAFLRRRRPAKHAS